MDHRYCREGMSTVGLNPNDSRLALDIKYTTQNRLVMCSCPLHKERIITVDPSGQQVSPTAMIYRKEDLLPNGHSLTLAASGSAK